MITLALVSAAYYFLNKKYPHIMNKNLLTSVGFFLFIGDIAARSRPAQMQHSVAPFEPETNCIGACICIDN